MNIKEFNNQLSTLIMDNEINNLKLKGIREELIMFENTINEKKEKNEIDNSIYFTVIRFKKVLENIINA